MVGDAHAGPGWEARRDLHRVADALGPRAERDRPLGALTTYRVGGRAAVFWEAGSEEDLLAARRALFGRRVPLLVLGRGSNLLVADAGFPGLVVRLGPDLSAIDVPAPSAEGPHAGGGSTHVVRAGGGAGLPVLARRSVEAGLAGLEWAVGVPGSVGGAVRMNAGGHGSDTAAVLARYRWVDLVHDAGGEDGPDRLHFGYRSSSISPNEVVVWADFALRPGSVEAGRRELSDIVAWRRRHQPGGSNAGSVFANPPGDSAGRLVEAAGLKGFRLGSARVSEKHANFIQADDGGSADDVFGLMTHVGRIVADRFGVALRPEVRLVGFPMTDNGGDGPLGGEVRGR
ncbi:MAG TPA: UDP-N-acetylmuramate dehydrogenase [Acidimicrobiales bacterium]|nr:UDP-N-acetylmuramate dehydrogenase [Acidimicrobiales bacterium]